MKISLDMELRPSCDEFRARNGEVWASVPLAEWDNVGVFEYSKSKARKALTEKVCQTLLDSVLAERNRMRRALFFASGEIALVEWRIESYGYKWISKDRKQSSGGSGGFKTLDEAIAYLKKHFVSVYGEVVNESTL